MRQVPEPGAVAAPKGGAHARRPHQTRSRPARQEILMSVSLPLVIVLGALVWVAWRFMGLRTWQAVMCLLLGFLLAATTAAPTIRHFITSMVRSLAGH